MVIQTQKSHHKLIHQSKQIFFHQILKVKLNIKGTKYVPFPQKRENWNYRKTDAVTIVNEVNNY